MLKLNRKQLDALGRQRAKVIAAQAAIANSFPRLPVVQRHTVDEVVEGILFGVIDEKLFTTPIITPDMSVEDIAVEEDYRAAIRAKLEAELILLAEQEAQREKDAKAHRAKWLGEVRVKAAERKQQQQLDRAVATRLAREVARDAKAAEREVALAEAKMIADALKKPSLERDSVADAINDYLSVRGYGNNYYFSKIY